jgi:hypothetical protein
MIILIATALAAAAPADPAVPANPHAQHQQKEMPEGKDCCCCKDKTGKEHASHDMDRRHDHLGQASR